MALVLTQNQFGDHLQLADSFDDLDAVEFFVKSLFGVVVLPDSDLLPFGFAQQQRVGHQDYFVKERSIVLASDTQPVI